MHAVGGPPIDVSWLDPGLAAALMLLAIAVASWQRLTLAYVDAVVLRPGQWYDPRYLASIFGMIIDNAMNGAALAAERLKSEMKAHRAELEACLAPGAAPSCAGRAVALTATVVVRWYRQSFVTAAGQLAERVRG